LIEHDQKDQRRGGEPVLRDRDGAKRPHTRHRGRGLVEIGIGDVRHLADDGDERDRVGERAEQGDRQRQGARKRVIGVGFWPKVERVGEIGEAEEDRFDREYRLENSQEDRNPPRQIRRRGAKQRRRGEQEDADVGRMQADQEGCEREGGDGEAQVSHGAGPRNFAGKAKNVKAH